MRAIALLGGLAGLLLAGQPAGAATIMKKPGFALTSPDVPRGGTVPDAFIANGFGCSGPNTSPALSWSGAPEGTKSFVLTVYDPDAPTGSGFWHWQMYNIPASVSSLPQGAGAAGKQPEGAVQGNNDAGGQGYFGPCPPTGDKPHRYVFTLYAVKADKLETPANPSPAVVGFVTHFVTLGKASFTAKYGR